MDWLKGDSGVDNPVTKCFLVEGRTQNSRLVEFLTHFWGYKSRLGEISMSIMVEHGASTPAHCGFARSDAISASVGPDPPTQMSKCQNAKF